MFLQSWIQMGGFGLNHHWHGINILSIFECTLIATAICLMLTLAARFVRRSQRLSAIALAGTLLFATAAYAANTALSNLSASGALAGANLIYVVQTAGVGGVKATMTQVATFINSLFSGDFTVTSGGAATLKNTGPGATGPLGSTTTVPVVTIDAQGRVTGLTSATAAGTVSSVATACGLSGGPVTTSGTIQSTANPTTQAGANYAFLAADMCSTVYLNNASAQIPTIPQANTTGFENGKYIEVCNIGAGTQTITPTTSTIGGAASYALAGGTAAAPKCIGIIANAGNYTLDQTGVGGSTSFANPTATGSDTAVNGSASTAMRSDAAPATQKGSNAQFGLAEGDNITTSMSAGVVSTKAGTINHPGYKASLWYPYWHGISSASGGPALTTAYCGIGQIGGNSSATITALGVRTTANGANIQLAIYNNDFTAGVARPGTLVDSTPNIVSSAFGNLSGSLNATHSINPGWYWFCIQTDNTTLRYPTPAASATDSTQGSYIGSATLANVLGTSTIEGVSTVTGITSFGTWPSTMVGSTFVEITNTAPIVAFEFSSVP